MVAVASEYGVMLEEQTPLARGTAVVGCAAAKLELAAAVFEEASGAEDGDGFALGTAEAGEAGGGFHGERYSAHGRDALCHYRNCERAEGGGRRTAGPRRRNRIPWVRRNPMKTDFILIDFENVQPDSLALLRGRDFKIMVFLGAAQAKLPTDLACELQALGANAEYIRCAGSGPNALDFHIAYHVGRLAAEHPDADFHIISRDTGFDPLIRHLKTRGTVCHRWASLSSIPGTKSMPAVPAAGPVRATAADPVQRVIENLAKRAAARPRTIKRLGSSIRDLLGAETGDAAIAKVVAELEARGVAKVTEGRVSYPEAQAITAGTLQRRAAE